MAFEDFLRTVPVVQKHIMRTRVLMHENKQLRNFLERNGISSDDVILNESEVDGDELEFVQNMLPKTDIEAAFKTLTTSLKIEQKRAAQLEASLYVLQIDYNALLLRSLGQGVESDDKASPKAKRQKSKR